MSPVLHQDGIVVELEMMHLPRSLVRPIPLYIAWERWGLLGDVRLFHRSDTEVITNCSALH